MVPPVRCNKCGRHHDSEQEIIRLAEKGLTQEYQKEAESRFGKGVKATVRVTQERLHSNAPTTEIRFLVKNAKGRVVEDFTVYFTLEEFLMKAGKIQVNGKIEIDARGMSESAD